MSFEWPRSSLTSLCLQIADCPHSTPVWMDKGVVVLRNQNIKNGKLDLSSPSFTDEENYLKRVKRAAPEAGDIVITREAPMGDVCQIPKGLRCCLGQRQVLLKPNPEKIDSRYLLFVLQSSSVQRQIGWNEGTGSTVSNLRIPVLESLQIEVPPLHIQNEIAQILGALDDRITLLRETNTTLEAIAQALFKSWFVDFDPVHANAGTQAPSLPPEIQKLFPSTFVESPLGLVPEGWRYGNLGDELKIAYGKNLPTTKLLEAGFPVFGGNGIIGFHSEYLYKQRQVLVACRGAASGKVNQSVPQSFVTNNSLVLESNEHLPFGFLKGFMSRSDLSVHVTGSAQPQVTIDNLRGFKILIPRKSIVEEFENVSSLVEDRIEQNNKQAQTLSSIRDTLLPRLISGQLRLPEVEEMVSL